MMMIFDKEVSYLLLNWNVLILIDDDVVHHLLLLAFQLLNDYDLVMTWSNFA